MYTCTVNGKKKKFNPSQNTRQKVLKGWLDEYLNKDYEEMKKHGLLSFIQLFYDNYKEENVIPVTVSEFNQKKSEI